MMCDLSAAAAGLVGSCEDEGRAITHDTISSVPNRSPLALQPAATSVGRWLLIRLLLILSTFERSHEADDAVQY